MPDASSSTRAKVLDKYAESVTAAIEGTFLAMERGDPDGVKESFTVLGDLMIQTDMFNAVLGTGIVNRQMNKLVQRGYRPIIDPEYDGSLGSMFIVLERWTGAGPSIMVKLLMRDEQCLDRELDEMAEEALEIARKKRDSSGFEGETILYGIAHDVEGCAVSTERVRSLLG